MIVNDLSDRKVTLPKNYAYSDGKPNEPVEPKVLFGKPVELKKGESLRKGSLVGSSRRIIRDSLLRSPIDYGNNRSASDKLNRWTT